MSAYEPAVDVAVVAVAQTQAAAISLTEVEIMLPLINAARDAVGITQDRIGFTCSGSSDFLAGQAFSFVQSLDAVGPYPCISESHVEMDGAWALYEAWVKMQLGEVDAALVFSYGRSSPGSLRDVLATQLDPYYLAPLWPDAFALAGIQARLLLESGVITEAEMAEAAAAARTAAVTGNPDAVRSGEVSAEELLRAPYVADPLRAHDLPAAADGGVAVILAAGDLARELCERPAWIRAVDHRIDSHQLGVRDLTSVSSASAAAERVGAASRSFDLAELHASFSFEVPLLRRALGLGADVSVNPSGGALVADTMMASGLMRIAHAAERIHRGEAGSALAHATSGPCLQQNLLCVLEGD
ncbi:MAG: lipid-transfer protein [Acidimicrobiales bacterium]|nr:lipid-transfer protein [Acidimicrobiales bacterium]